MTWLESVMNMTWHDLAGFIGLILIVVGGQLSFLENESVAYAGRFMVLVGAFVIAIAWPYGAGV